MAASGASRRWQVLPVSAVGVLLILLAAVMFVAEATGRPGFVVPGLIAAVVAELIASSAGLGYRMMENTNQMDTAGTMAGIIILMAIVVILNSALDKAEDHFLRWRPKESDTQKD